VKDASSNSPLEARRTISFEICLLIIYGTDGRKWLDSSCDLYLRLLDSNSSSRAVFLPWPDMVECAGSGLFLTGILMNLADLYSVSRRKSSFQGIFQGLFQGSDCSIRLVEIYSRKWLNFMWQDVPGRQVSSIRRVLFFFFPLETNGKRGTSYLFFGSL